MRRILLCSTVSFALAALAPLHAQTIQPRYIYSATPYSAIPAERMISVTPSPPLTYAYLSPEQPPAPYARFLDSTAPMPLKPSQKFGLAARNLANPHNLATITYNAAFTVATNSHTPYGPGWNGFIRDAHLSLTQDATGEFFGTFLIPSLTHEDPHYHRMPHAGIPRRIVHAISRTLIAQSDTGAAMPNFCTLLGYPIDTEIANLYVPGIHTNGPSTVARIMTGYATDPIDNLITEFLPHVARRVHVHVLFAQRILNHISSEDYPLQ
jgi:hypothetical protein